VADVRDGLDGGSDVGYTTVLKFLQIMVTKGLLRRNEDVRPHVYRPAVDREATQRRLVSDLIERAFGGSSADLVQRALDAKPATRKELAEIRKMLDGNKGDSK
jgi:predicted transcriptional regulator